MSKLKIPRTRRDKYRLLRYLEESENLDDSCNNFETSDGQAGCRYELAEIQATANTNSSGYENEGMQPLVAPLRYKNKSKDRRDYPTFHSNGTDFRKGEGDFVDMPCTRAYTVQQENLSTHVPPKPMLDDLDSPVKPVLNETLHEQQKREARKKFSGKHLSCDHVDYELGKPTFTYFDIIFYMFSIGSYLADVGSDCWVAYMYYTGKFFFFTEVMFSQVCVCFGGGGGGTPSDEG